jgi:hypothetical protein
MRLFEVAGKGSRRRAVRLFGSPSLGFKMPKGGSSNGKSSIANAPNSRIACAAMERNL